MTTLVLATHNRHKQEELLAILQREIGAPIRLLTLDDVEPSIGDIPETGETLEENAAIKARTVFERTGLPTIADDTGLDVTALGGAPGVYSARYAGPKASYDDNVRKLLAELQGKHDRSARFRTVVCYIDDSQEDHFLGEVKGTITEAPRGSAGFGYDPVFAPTEDPAGRTFAEMNADEKHALSHRGRAVRAFVEFLRSRMNR